MARPTTHGVRQLANRVKADRTDPATRRRIAGIQRHLVAAPVEALVDLFVGRIARKEELAQRAELALLNAPDLDAASTGLGKFATWIWNSLRRDTETLALLLDRADADRKRAPDLASYLEQRAADAPATPPAPAAPATHTDTIAAADDAAHAPAGGDNGIAGHPRRTDVDRGAVPPGRAVGVRPPSKE